VSDPPSDSQPTGRIASLAAYCGAQIDRIGPSFLVSSISSASLDFPRVLSTGGSVNGVATARIECNDQIDWYDAHPHTRKLCN
jgi:hypothetical protein